MYVQHREMLKSLMSLYFYEYLFIYFLFRSASINKFVLFVHENHVASNLSIWQCKEPIKHAH